jgi:hypothetical protein
MSTPLLAAALAERRGSLRATALPSPLSTTSARRGSAVAIPFAPSPFSSSYTPTVHTPSSPYGISDEQGFDVLPPSSPTSSDEGKEPLLVSPSDVRRPSFILTSASTLSPTKLATPLLTSPIRRLAAVLLGAVSLFALVTLFSPHPLPRTLSTLRSPASRFHGLTSYRTRQPSSREAKDLNLEELLSLISRDKIIAAGERLPSVQPKGESRHLLKRLTANTNGAQLILSDAELKEIQSVREQLLWGTGEAELETVVVENSASHFSTVIYIHVRFLSLLPILPSIF